MASDRFNHSFDGWSVWIEPCPSEEAEVLLIREIELLADQCGGSACGVHPFVPHCTLLYNINPLKEKEGLSKEQTCSNLLNECIDTFQRVPNVNQDETETNHVQLLPTSFYLFPYPKQADNGRGFGCVISLILLNKTEALQKLYESVRAVFPPDERNEFIPHLSLVYAPESRGEWLQSYTQEMNEERIDLLKPFRARYLSLWSTQGNVSDWYRISRVELP
jgi:2'-5' RNA ligase